MRKFYNTNAENGRGNNDVENKSHEYAGPSDLDQAIINERFGEEIQKRIKNFRVRIDSFFLTSKRLQPSREVSLAITSFQQARQFCGIILGEKGSAYPYKSMNTPGPVVGERNDKGEVLMDILTVSNLPVGSTEEIERLRAFRSKVEDVITDFSIYVENNTYGSVKEFIAQNEVLKNLISGKMWLGEQMAVLSGAK